MDSPARLIIKYFEDLLPSDYDGLAIFYYDQNYGWTQLASPEDFVPEGPQVAADVNHFSFFIALAKVGEGVAPANIVVQKLTLDPGRVLPGHDTAVRARVINQGELPGEATWWLESTERYRKHSMLV
jgi:hypothetical protein